MRNKRPKKSHYVIDKSVLAIPTRPLMAYKGKAERIRSLDCVAKGHWTIYCCEKIDCTHVTTESYAGGNIKNDKRMLPQCRLHHSIQWRETVFGKRFLDLAYRTL